MSYTGDYPKDKTYKFRCDQKLSNDIELNAKRKGISVSEYIRLALVEMNAKNKGNR